MKVLELLVLLIVAFTASFAFDDEHILRRGLFHRLRHLEPPNRFPNPKSSEDQWFQQRLDHFNPMNTKTWQQRYFSRYEESNMNLANKHIIIIFEITLISLSINMLF